MTKILLVTTVAWSCAERLAGALGTAEIEAVFPPGDAIAQSRYLKRAYRYRALFPTPSIRSAIVESAPDLVIPCEDRAAILLSEIYNRAEGEERALLKRSLGAPGLFHGLYDRRRFITEAARAGVPAAGMLPANDEAALERGLRCFGLPLVVKSDASCGGDGVIIAHTRQEAFEAWRRLGRKPQWWRELARVVRRRDLHFIASALKPADPVVGLQRFIPGRPATSSLFCWQGELLAANHFDVEIAQNGTGPASVLTRRDCPQMEDAGRRVARHFGLSGLIGLDFIRDGNGQVHLLEINPRATPTSHLALGPRHDPCAALLEQLGVPAAARPAVTTASQIALFPQEWRRAPDSPWLANAFHDVPWDDPAVVHALLGETGLQQENGLNDDFVGEFGKLLVLQGLKADWERPALTIRQGARQ